MAEQRPRQTAASPNGSASTSTTDGATRTKRLTDAPQTILSEDSARSVITFNRSPDVPFDRSINPTAVGEHGCCYCFARLSHAYLGFSPGLDFETRLV